MFLTRVQWPAFAPGIIMLITETLIHPELSLCPNARVLFQRAARGVAMQDEQILLLFTERYNDFSFPGGGVDDGEDIITGLVREMEEETGARGVKVGREFARVDEKRPHWKSEFDVLHMVSHFHFCEINSPLQEVRMESYEIANGMRPLWVSLDEAIQHNRAVMQRQESTMGLSIQRETLMLEHVQRLSQQPLPIAV